MRSRCLRYHRKELIAQKLIAKNLLDYLRGFLWFKDKVIKEVYSSTHSPLRQYTPQRVALPFFSEPIYCSFFFRDQRRIVGLPSGSSSGPANRYWNLSSILSLISRSSASFGGRVSRTLGNLDAAKNIPAAPSRKIK